VTYTPPEPDLKEYLAQIRRHRDAMITAITSDSGVRVPPDLLEVAKMCVEDGYKTVERWIRFKRGQPSAESSRLPTPRD
jgi:hypothetical protein